MMRHVASKTPQKSNQFWFLRHATHVNARWRAVCEWAFTGWQRRWERPTVIRLQLFDVTRQMDETMDYRYQSSHSADLRRERPSRGFSATAELLVRTANVVADPPCAMNLTGASRRHVVGKMPKVPRNFNPLKGRDVNWLHFAIQV